MKAIMKCVSRYITGTEEGYIHKCSCSYNEQYLDTFEGHGGPVYDIKWSPFCKDLFLSCSADWSIRYVINQGFIYLMGVTAFLFYDSTINYGGKARPMNTYNI